MKVGIMQPYFFPYIGYFSLIHAVDHWVVFDEVQFIRHGWIERNKVLNSNLQTSYVKVPLQKRSRETLIKDVKINYNPDWKKKIFDQLTSYKNKAPRYNETIEFLNESLKEDFLTVSELNIHLLSSVCEYLGLSFNYSIYSEMSLNINDKIQHPGQWALEITKSLGGNTYINPMGGKDLFSKSEFDNSNIKLLFCKNNLTPYHQFNKEFQEGLSIIDVLMFNSKNSVLDLINDYKLI